jgi:hypothetical protein
LLQAVADLPDETPRVGLDHLHAASSSMRQACSPTSITALRPAAGA